MGGTLAERGDLDREAAMSEDSLAANVAQWTKTNAEFTDEQAERAWRRDRVTWGVFGIADEWFGDVDGLDVVELGCGTAFEGAQLARRGARVVGVDPTPAQLATARRLMKDVGPEFPLVEAPAESVPLPDDSFDLAFSDYGASLWADPRKWIPEAARLLRPGGRLLFLTTSSLAHLCTPEEDEVPITNALVRPHFAQWEVEWPGYEGVEYHLSHGDWIRVLCDAGFVVDALHELRPADDAASHEYYYVIPVEWARRWPGEELWEAHLR
jgi:ubiquinone/menaquinone biosynthesis C-methylase UbiE